MSFTYLLLLFSNNKSRRLLWRHFIFYIMKTVFYYIVVHYLFIHQLPHIGAHRLSCWEIYYYYNDSSRFRQKGGRTGTVWIKRVFFFCLLLSAYWKLTTWSWERGETNQTGPAQQPKWTWQHPLCLISSWKKRRKETKLTRCRAGVTAPLD